MSYSGFQKIWDGFTWKGIMDEVYTKENIDFHKTQKSNKGEANGHSIYSDNEVMDIRKYYVNHTLKETFNVYKKKSEQKVENFRKLIKTTYKHLPIYSKIRKKWYLGDEEININEYNPVSTISVSGE